MTFRHLLYLSIGSACLTAGDAAGQPMPQQNAPGVYVRDSTTAVEKLSLAERMEHLREWEKAADIYFDVLHDFGDRVVRAGDSGSHEHYTSVIPAVQDRLAKWPADALAIYRRRYEPQASALLDSANGDPAILQRVVSNFFVTDAAKRAALELIERDIESGAFAAAAWQAQRLLDLHPLLTDDDRAALEFRRALAEQFAGRTADAQATLERLKAANPSAIGLVDGKDANLVEALDKLLHGQPLQQAQSAQSWMMPFGNPQRNAVPALSGFGGARLASIDIVQPSFHAVPMPQRGELEQQWKRDVLYGMASDILPTVDRGELYFQDNARLYAVSLESGEPLPGWTETYHGARPGVYTVPGAWPLPRSRPCGIALTDESAFAIMGQSDITAMQFGGGVGLHDCRLVCLDRRTGKEHWIRQPKNLPENLRGLDFSGTPLVFNGSIFIQARGGKTMSFDDAYVLSFNADTGEFNWASYIASSNNLTADMDPTTIGAPGSSFLAIDSNRLFVQTSVGAVAALDINAGTILWLNVYPREAADPNALLRLNGFRGGGSGAAPRKPWQRNPVIASGGRLFVMPDDSSSLFVYDQGSGAELRRIHLQDFDNARTLLGVVGDRVILNSDKQIFCIEWSKYRFDDAVHARADGERIRAVALTPDMPAGAADSLAWMTNELKRSDISGDAIRGRGFVTSDSVIIPTAWQLLRYSLAGGVLKQTYPTLPVNKWNDDEGPGNVLMVQDHLILAGPVNSGAMRVSVYTDLQVAIAKLNAAAVAAPHDAEPLLRYAEMLFSAGQVDVALAKLDAAVALMPETSDSDGSIRARCFNVALGFGRKLEKDEHADLSTVNGIFDRVKKLAATPAQQVSYRLAYAGFDRQTDAATQRISLFQEILSDESWRNVFAPDASGDPSTAGQVAQQGIADAISAGGSYATTEAAADKIFADAQATQDPDRLKAVALTFPNSKVAGRALVAAAERQQFSNDYAGAVQLLRRAARDFPASIDQSKVLSALAQNYLMIPGRTETAAARLNQLAKLNPAGRLDQPLLLPDGSRLENLTFAEAATAVAALKRAVPPQLPDINLPPAADADGKPRTPVPKPFSNVGAPALAQNIGQLLEPIEHFSRNDRVVATMGNRVLAFKPGQSDAAFSIAVAADPTAVAWVGGNLVLMLPQELCFASGESGKDIWRVALQSVAMPGTADSSPNGGAEAATDAAVAPAPMPEGRVFFRGNQRFIIRNAGQLAFIAAQQRQQNPADGVERTIDCRPLSDRLVFSTTAGRVIALTQDSGKLLWQINAGDRPPGKLLATDDFVVVQSTDDNGLPGDIAVYDATDGKLLTRQHFNGDQPNAMPPFNIALAPSGMLVMLFPDRVCGKDLFESGALDAFTCQGAVLSRDPAAAFVNELSPDNLKLVDDRILVICDNNTHVRAFNLTDCKPLPFRSVNYIDTGAPPGTPVQLDAVGARVYLTSTTQVHGFNLEHPADWSGAVAHVNSTLITKTHLLALHDQPHRGNAPAGPMTTVLDAFSLASDRNGNESGMLEFISQFPAGQNVEDWQAVDGGVYYLTGDHKLYFLRGAADPANRG